VLQSRAYSDEMSEMKTSLLPLIVITCILAVTMAASDANTIDFGAQGNQTPAGPFSLDGVTITGSSTLSFQSGAGFAILGGLTIFGYQLISDNEFATFSFATGSATGISFNHFIITGDDNSSPIGIEAFAVGGGSLGTQFVNWSAVIQGVNVSALFGNVALSAFSILGSPSGGLALDIRSLDFTPQSVPENGGTVMLLASSLLCFALAGITSRHRKKE
jgi:hypothetical protein